MIKINQIMRRVIMTKLTKSTRTDYRKKIQAIIDALCKKFNYLKHLHDIRLKHMLWVRDEWLGSYAITTQNDYLRALIMFVRALFKDHWLKHMRLNDRAGRPYAYEIIKNKKGSC